MSLLANCGMTQFFTPTDLTTAEFLQRRGGMWTAESRSRSYSGPWHSVHRSESRSDHPRFPAATRGGNEFVRGAFACVFLGHP